MAAVLMYCTATCPYCQAAERLFAEKGIVELTRIRVDLDPRRRAEMTERSARRSVPQIWIGTRYVGGFDDLYELEQAGELDALLQST